MKPLRMTAIAIAGTLAATGAFAQAKDYREIPVPPLHQIKVEQPKRIQLANGMVILLMENHELPLIEGQIRIRGGSRNVPADKAGLAGIYGQTWRTGGTEKQTGDQLDDFLETRAAHVETGSGDESMRVSFQMLKGDLDAVFPIVVDLLQHPAFRQEKIDLAKTQANSAISRRNDDAQGIAGREAAKLGYGANTSYTRQSEYATIASITRDDLLAFHKKYVHPNNILIGVTGDFDAAAMEKRLRAAFESWPKGPAAPKETPDDRHPAKPGVYFVGKDDITQSYVSLIGQGVKRDTPDYYALNVMNEIFSGGFSGRLMNDIRAKRGLAYSVGGSVGTDWDHPGLFRVSAGTKSGSTVEALTALRGEISDLVSKPFTSAEVEDAKQTLLNAFVFTRDAKSKILNQRLDLEFHGYPADWYDRYVAGIEKVTPADVERVAKKYVTPDQLAVLVVGNEKEFDKPLSTLGSVTPIDITIPEANAAPKADAKPAAGAAPVTRDTNAGVALVKKVQDFVGGKAKIDAVQAVRSVGTMKTKTPGGEMEMEIDTLVRYPDTRRTIMKTPMGEMTMVATPEGSFVSTPMGVQDLPSSQRESQKAEARFDMLNVLKNVDKPGYTFAVTGTEKVDNVDAAVLEITTEGSTVKWWVDPATGRPLRRTSKSRAGETVTTVGDWKPFGGLQFFTTFASTANGEQVGSGTLTTVEVNPAFDPKVFEKPVK